MKNITKITLAIVLLFILTLGYKVYKFDFSSLEDQEPPIIEESDSFSNAQKILEDYGYNLKDVQENEKIQDDMPDLKTYRYERKNGIISIFANGDYIYMVNYYEE
ncbi:hypothetical protein QJS64_20660 (plasmid) [Paraclostridium bifermentans]|uniref:DUF4830 domain-containing protein n=1 Tax=Paraclostridium bifermentans TaxID=1490 RepID=A0ABY8R814_PARBF|nr:hypothetical protein QJS64_20660 [Paraclostridium bifermentans]